ncbi:hypothetical protein Tsubulata_002356 [Turnera subulata]|uniref:Uncharacterized protein n=1 Tax=Turnera subulata TaxID=218843 RepID=A0A9Q0JJU2_9ROSI|nr:hypothetical protein Tsubulata_002356 [Turnera subulata]
MAFGISLLSLFTLFALSILSFAYSKAQMVPAMFIFGDSVVDVGNNNYLPCVARADFPNNGIDFPTKKPTGRFSNGKNAADLLAEKLNLPSSPPYLSLLLGKNDSSFLTGANFASGGSGILNGTGRAFGPLLPLTKQVAYYLSVYEHLVHKLGSNGAKKRLSKSLFVIVTGNNDLSSYSRDSDLRKRNTPQQYSDSMLLVLKGQIKRLHIFGARKFVVTGVGSLGCSPSQRSQNEGERCDESLNSQCVSYNKGLKSMLQELKSKKLMDIHYSYFDTRRFTEVRAACCGLGKLNAEFPCLPISTVCSNRSNHVFWDGSHPTEATDRVLVDAIFDDPSHYTFPMNLRQLVAV